MRNAFLVGRHVVDVFQSENRWCAALDGVLLRGWHRTLADAWAAGVREADRVDGCDRPPRAPVPSVAA